MTDSYKVKDLPLDDRPREKLALRGADALTNSELIAILLRTGLKGKSVLEISKQLIAKYDGLPSLATKSIGALIKNDGIGKDKAATLVAAFELGRRANSDMEIIRRKKITSPKDVADYFMPKLRDEVKEKFLVVCLNTSNKIIKEEVISVGSLNASIVHPREVFKVAIDNNSANIILLHNHPSGNAEPSGEDVAITKKLISAGEILDIKVFDHIIVAGNSYMSFVEERLI